MKINSSWASRLRLFSYHPPLRFSIASALMLLASLAHAQETLFEETFDSDAGQFSTQGSVYASEGDVRLRGGSSAGTIVSPTIDASGYTNLTLSFDRTTTGLDAGESGRALVSINGGSFTAVESTQNATGRTTVQLGSAADNGTIQIAFDIDASSFFEIYALDNVVVEGVSDIGPPPGENAASGFYLEGGSSATTPDQFSFTNTGEVAITALVIDLTSGAGAPVFDPVDVPFAVTSSDSVGFSGNFDLNGSGTILTLSFSGFDPGETFGFNADLDDGNGVFTTGADVAGTLLTAVAAGSDNATGSFVVDSGNSDQANVVTGDDPPPPPGCASGDPTVVLLEANLGPCDYGTINVSSSVSGFGGGTIHYPTDGGPYGVIAVVPGFVSPESSIQWWGPRLSSHGFVVITIDTNSGFDDPASRAAQLRNALDYTIGLSNSGGSAISGLVDSSKQGVMGWSMGGGGSLILAADDPSLKAIIPQAPWHSGSNDFDEIVVPTLILACESDSTAPVSSHASPFYNAIPGSTPKAFLEINNGSHSCANSGNSNADLLGKYGVAWMKRFMDNDTRYSPYLCGAPHQADLSGLTISEYRETCPY